MSDNSDQYSDDGVATPDGELAETGQSNAAIVAAAADIERLEAAIAQVVIGQQDVIRQVIICLLAGGHALIEGVPGLGKTLLVRTLSALVNADHGRIQFTPDLMPSDVTGHALFNMKSERFEVRRGPVFTNLLLADEINRAPAKTQAALLEVMQERQVTIEGESLDVGRPFMVLATQNPIEQDGTYPLPEAELDRFMMKVLIDYPEANDEIALVSQVTAQKSSDGLPDGGLSPVISRERLLDLIALARTVSIDDEVMRYLVDVGRSTRSAVSIEHGAGPRAGLALARAARVSALLDGRDFVVPDDVKSCALPILRHRVALSAELEIEGAKTDDVLSRLLADVVAPRR